MPPQRKLIPVLALSLILGGCLGGTLGGCALTPREAFTAADQAAAVVPGFGTVRAWGDAPLENAIGGILGCSRAASDTAALPSLAMNFRRRIP